MTKHTSLTKPVALSLLAVSTMAALVLFARIAPPRSATRTTAEVREAYGQLPLSFEENRGQADGSINFLARGPGYTLALSPTDAAFALSRRSDELPARGGQSISERDQSPDRSAVLPPSVFRMNLVGANREAGAAGLDAFEGKVNYLIGTDQAQWRTNIPTFGRVRYREVYPGIDLVYYGNQRQLEYDFVIAPGTDAGGIALEFTGTDSVEIEKETGDLVLRVGENTIRQHKPESYQEAGGKRRKVESRYAMKANGRVGFEVGAYDRSAPLIIDPVLVYSTYVGGSGTDLARAIAVDPSGNACITGYTTSLNFPTANAFQAAFNGMTASFGNRDVFVTKINAAGNALVYSTYLGGSGGEEARGIAVDSSGNAYVAGFTDSTDFPIANAVQATMGGTQDAFVTKLNADGSALVYSTFLGGAGGIDGSNSSEFGEAIAVDSSGNAYVTGSTFANNFPTVNAIQGTFGGGSTDAFVTKINAAGDAFIYSTYLGGNGDAAISGIGGESGRGIAADSSGNTYVTGEINSTNFPTANAIQATYGGGGTDAFVAKINADGSAFVYSTYLGGGDQDSGEGVKADASGNTYVAGFTVSNNFPTANAFQTTFGGAQDAILTKLNADGSAFVYSTYLGGTGGEIAFGIAVDASNSVYIGGSTGSFNTFPVRNANQCTRNGGQDLFITKFNPEATELIYSTYIGGSGTDSGEGIALDSSNNPYMTGSTTSTDFPTVNPIQAANGGGQDAFVIKFNDALPPGACATTSPTPTPTATPTPTPTPTPTATPAQLLNISTRARVGTDDNVMIGGFIIRGNANKPVVVRALGPSLTGMAVPADAVLLDPVLSLHGPNGELIRRNDNWKDDQRPSIEGTIYQPADDRESVIVATLPPEAYTAIVSGKDRTTGIGVVEVYDNDPAVDSQLANISTRGFVENGDNFIIGGFILGGPNQGSPRVVIRALGPSLAAFGVPNALQDTILELRDENGAALLSNDDWQQSQQAEIAATGLAPTDIRESAIVVTAPVGRYFAVVQGKNGTTGVAVVEIYSLP